jgi:probable F420-dependent oxidoreductase
MRFAISLAFQPVDQLVALAREADACGYDALAIPDHVVELEELATPYPYTADGQRRWDHAADWPDPWVLVGALAQVTTDIRFFTSVYVAALRSPYLVAKAVSTAAVLSHDRVALGVGVGWCREEFELMQQDFSTRGRRTDEALELLRSLLEPGWTEFDGDHYQAPRLVMEPTPRAPVPVYVGGLSEVAFARAARHDGWIGDLYTVEEAARHARRLAEIRDQSGATGDFRVITALTDAFLPEQFADAEAQGITDVWTMPWAYYHGLDASLEQKLDGIRRFAADVLAPLRTEASLTDR